MTAAQRLKSTLELLVVLLLAFFIRLYASIQSRSRRNLKAGQMMKKREADEGSHCFLTPMMNHLHLIPAFRSHRRGPRAALISGDWRNGRGGRSDDSQD